jgi:hypothetical protein
VQVRSTVPGWLVTAPRYLQLAAPDWAAAAVRAMTLHAEAGRLQQAATAARAAVLVSGGLADLGGDTLRDAHAKIRARAGEILEKAKHSTRNGCRPSRARTRSDESLFLSLLLPGPDYSDSCSTKRLRERSTSASAEARSDQCEPSTDLPGSRSL